MTIKDFIDYNNNFFSDLAEASDILESTCAIFLTGKVDLRRCTAQTVRQIGGSTSCTCWAVCSYSIQLSVWNMARLSTEAFA